MAISVIVGYDISTCQQVEDRGRTFSDGEGTEPLERILARHGATHIRLRLWLQPPYPYSDLPHVLDMARRVADAGLRLLLDFHYCDFWADPGKQPVPVVWADQPVPTLARSVREYTASVTEALKNQGTPPHMVQIGNEITAGMLWPQGKLYVDGTERWDEFVTLLGAGIAGVQDAMPAPKGPAVMVHIDRGADNKGARYFYDQILARGVAFDVIGLSYYSWWHGSLSGLRDNLHDLARRYEKDMVVVETAYPWTMETLDSAKNVVAPGDELIADFPPTPEGQLAYLRELRSIVEGTPDGRGAGVMYWEPAWLPDVGWEPNEGNGWGQLNLCDPTGQMLPSIDGLANPV